MNIQKLAWPPYDWDDDWIVVGYQEIDLQNFTAQFRLAPRYWPEDSWRDELVKRLDVLSA
jgi:hypothetical protein